jgi:hypothetical protein
MGRAATIIDFNINPKTATGFLVAVLHFSSFAFLYAGNVRQSLNLFR